MSDSGDEADSKQKEAKKEKGEDHGPWWGEIEISTKRDDMPIWKYWQKNKEDLMKEYSDIGNEADVFAKAMWKFLHMDFEEKEEYYTMSEELKKFYDKKPTNEELDDIYRHVYYAGRPAAKS